MNSKNWTGAIFQEIFGIDHIKNCCISQYSARQILIEITQMYAILGHLDRATTLVTPWKAAVAGHYYSFRHRWWVALSYRHKLSHTCHLYITSTATCLSSHIFTRNNFQSVTTRSGFWIISGLSNLVACNVLWIAMLYRCKLDMWMYTCITRIRKYIIHLVLLINVSDFFTTTLAEMGVYFCVYDVPASTTCHVYIWGIFYSIRNVSTLNQHSHIMIAGYEYARIRYHQPNVQSNTAIFTSYTSRNKSR